MRKCIVCKVPIDLNIYYPVDVAASTNSNNPIADLIDAFNASIVETMNNIGFSSTVFNPRHISKRNGGYAVYDTFILKEDLVQFKLILDIRASDHPSKPDLVSRNLSREETLSSIYPELRSSNANLALLDTYCKQHDWGIQIFIGGNSEYSNPITSIEKALHVIQAKVKVIVKDKFTSACKAILSNYSNEAIELAQDYLDETEDVESFLLQGEDVISSPIEDDEQKQLLLTYLDIGAEEELFDSAKQFNEVCSALKILNKYS